MIIDLLTLGAYGQFVWPAFIFSFVGYFLLYIKTKSELKKQEKKFLIEFNYYSLTKTKNTKQKELSKEILSSIPIY